MTLNIPGLSSLGAKRRAGSSRRRGIKTGTTTSAPSRKTLSTSQLRPCRQSSVLSTATSTLRLYEAAREAAGDWTDVGAARCGLAACEVARSISGTGASLKLLHLHRLPACGRKALACLPVAPPKLLTRPRLHVMVFTFQARSTYDVSPLFDLEVCRGFCGVELLQRATPLQDRICDCCRLSRLVSLARTNENLQNLTLGGLSRLHIRHTQSNMNKCGTLAPWIVVQPYR